MSWARYDDELTANRKVIWLLSKGQRGLAALGLHLVANTYCRHNGTKGRIDAHVPEFLAGRSGRVAADLLVEAGMFDVDGDGWIIHDYAEFHDPSDPHPDRSAADRKRELSEKRKAAGSLGGKQRASKAKDLLQAKSKQTSSPVPDPVPTTKVTTPPTDCVGPDRLVKIINVYADIAYTRSNGVSDEAGWKAAVRKRIAGDPELQRLADLFPTAPPDAVAAWLHGDKGSMAYYPRADELAEVVPLQRKDNPA